MQYQQPDEQYGLRREALLSSIGDWESLRCWRCPWAGSAKEEEGLEGAYGRERWYGSLKVRAGHGPSPRWALDQQDQRRGKRDGAAGDCWVETAAGDCWAETWSLTSALHGGRGLQEQPLIPSAGAVPRPRPPAWIDPVGALRRGCWASTCRGGRWTDPSLMFGECRLGTEAGPIHHWQSSEGRWW